LLSICRGEEIIAAFLQKMTKCKSRAQSSLLSICRGEEIIAAFSADFRQEGCK
jgi:hypothetical protein